MMGIAGFPLRHFPPGSAQGRMDPGGAAAAALTIAIMLVCYFFLRRGRWIP
jgi:hypothetical protein